ncbi:hypothetical protein FB446DRAFT_790042 [Lentinula raphanica]|nr:hypothetical protein FB446DRAFT_790042 [Lentinula raphanica]
MSVRGLGRGLDWNRIRVGGMNITVCLKKKTPNYLEHHHSQRRWKQAAEKDTALDSTVSNGMRSRLAATVSQVNTDFNCDILQQSTSDYLGHERVNDSSLGSFEVISANVENPEPMLLTDSKHCVFAA